MLPNNFFGVGLGADKLYDVVLGGGAVPYLEKFYMMGVLGGVESKFWCLTQFHTLSFWGGGVKKNHPVAVTQRVCKGWSLATDLRVYEQEFELSNDMI